MLIYKGTKEEILLPLQNICGIADKKVTLPISSHVLIEGISDKLQFITTDLEIQMRSFINYSVIEEKISITANAQKLVEILKSLPSLANIEIFHEANRLIVKSGKSKFNLQSLNGDNFPVLQLSNQTSSSFTIKQRELKKIINKTNYAMAHKEVRYFLNGLLIKFEENKLIGVATDSHRLAYCFTDIDGILPELELILPRKAVVELNNLLLDNDDLVEITPHTRQIVFNLNNIEFISKIVDGKYPDFNRIIPVDFPSYIIVNRQLMINCLGRINVMTDKDKTIVVSLIEDNLSFDAGNIQEEDAYEEIQITRSSDLDFKLYFNINYLLEVLHVMNTEYFKWEYRNNEDSTLITETDNFDFKYVLMPMHM